MPVIRRGVCSNVVFAGFGRCHKFAQAVRPAGCFGVHGFQGLAPHPAVKLFTASGVVCEALDAVDADASSWSHRL
eukprot:gene4721-6031_t